MTLENTQQDEQAPESETVEGAGLQKDVNADADATWSSWSAGPGAKKAAGRAQPKARPEKERTKDRSDPGAQEKLEIEGESEVLARAANATGHTGEDAAELE